MVRTVVWREIAHRGYDKGHEVQLLFPSGPWWGGLTPVLQAIKVVTPAVLHLTDSATGKPKMEGLWW